VVSAITILCGPPCSGKTTYAREHAVAGDVVLDYDELMAELSGMPLYYQPFSLRGEAERVFQERAAAMRQGWIIRSAPRKEQRGYLRELYHARSLVLIVPAAICIARLELTGRPADVKLRQREYVYEWHRQYTPSTSPEERMEVSLEVRR